jgi:maltodextrin utilization protein YvdJ
MGILASLGIGFITDLVKGHGEELVSKGIEKVTGIKLDGKTELTSEQKQLIMDSEYKLKSLDFEVLKEQNRANEFETIENNKNTSNARENNTKIQESENSSWLAKNTPYILDFIAIGAVFLLGALLFFVDVPKGNIQILNIMFGTLLTMAGTVYNYHRGSSKGSVDKQNQINSLTKGK